MSRGKAEWLVQFRSSELYLELSGNRSDSLSMDFVIITALEEEFEAVKRLLPDCKRVPPSEHDTRVFFRSDIDVEFSDNIAGKYSVVLLCLNSMGRVEAANATNDAIRRFSPKYALLVGIAGGIKKNGVALGDILISDQVVDYEKQKIYPTGPEFRFESHQVDRRFLNSARHYSVHECLGQVNVPRPETDEPKKHIGPIASGDKVVADREFLKEFLQHYPKSIGVEMESGGLAAAAFALPSKPGFFMVRAVSDYADAEKDSDETKSWRPYACSLAASYTIGLLKSGPIPLSAPEAFETKPSDTQEEPELVAAKKELLVHALRNDNTIQTILSISSCPFGIALGKRLYKSEEEVLLFVEALKSLISEGLVDGFFERASKNYSLTYNGLRCAKKVESRLEADGNFDSKKKIVNRNAAQNKHLGALCVSDLESIRQHLDSASKNITHLNSLPAGFCRTDRQSDSVIHFYHPNFGCSIQFRYMGAPHAGQDPGLRLLFSGDKFYDLKPEVLGAQLVWYGIDDREIGDAKAVSEFILQLISDKEFVRNLPKAHEDDD